MEESISVKLFVLLNEWRYGVGKTRELAKSGHELGQRLVWMAKPRPGRLLRLAFVAYPKRPQKSNSCPPPS